MRGPLGTIIGPSQGTKQLLRQATEPEEAVVSVLTARFRNEGHRQ